jgi:hypothetical protein
VTGISINPAALATSGALALPLLLLSSSSPTRSWTWTPTAQDGTTPVYQGPGQPVQNSIIPQVVLEESGEDVLRTTDHPVEQGSNVTDHAYKMPAEVQVRAGWSFAGQGANPGGVLGALSAILPVGSDPSYLSTLYAQLLDVQAQRYLVTLVTGKRTYNNMLLTHLSQRTDEKTENTLMIVANFREIIFAQTQVVSIPDASVMKNPQINQATTDAGTATLQPGTAVNQNAANAVLPPSLGGTAP